MIDPLRYFEAKSLPTGRNRAKGAEPNNVLIDMTAEQIPQPLTAFSRGTVVKLAFLTLIPAEAERLRDLGLCEGRLIHIIRNTESFVCKVEASRVVLRREVAMKVFAVPSAV